MRDLADQSDNDIQAERDRGLDAVRKKLAPQDWPGFDGLCVDCEEPVGPGRRKYGFIRCLECQTEKERRERFHG